MAKFAQIEERLRSFIEEQNDWASLDSAYRSVIVDQRHDTEPAARVDLPPGL